MADHRICQSVSHRHSKTPYYKHAFDLRLFSNEMLSTNLIIDVIIESNKRSENQT